ncbi:hypothetical protein ACOSP7_007119 [Xanthoceras sorbifolium]
MHPKNPTQKHNKPIQNTVMNTIHFIIPKTFIQMNHEEPDSRTKHNQKHHSHPNKISIPKNPHCIRKLCTSQINIYQYQFLQLQTSKFKPSIAIKSKIKTKPLLKSQLLNLLLSLL